MSLFTFQSSILEHQVNDSTWKLAIFKIESWDLYPRSTNATLVQCSAMYQLPLLVWSITPITKSKSSAWIWNHIGIHGSGGRWVQVSMTPIGEEAVSNQHLPLHTYAHCEAHRHSDRKTLFSHVRMSQPLSCLIFPVLDNWQCRSDQ